MIYLFKKCVQNSQTGVVIITENCQNIPKTTEIYGKLTEN